MVFRYHFFNFIKTVKLNLIRLKRHNMIYYIYTNKSGYYYEVNVINLIFNYISQL